MRKLVALAVSCVLSLAALELALRWRMRDRADFHLRLPGEERIFDPSPGIMPGIEGASLLRVNALGIRGDEMPRDQQTARVLCVGGSTTECLYLDQEESWPELLEARWSEGSQPIWIGNAGRSGFSTLDHLAFLRDSPVLDQVDAVILMVGINDFMLRLRGFDFESGPAERALRKLLARPLLTQPGMLGLGRRTAAPGGLIEREDAFDYPSRRAHRRSSAIVEPPSLEDAIAGYRRRLEEIVRTARARGLVPYLVTQPVLWDERLDASSRDLLWFGKVSRRGYLSVENLRAGMDRYNDALREVCRERGLTCIDLSALNGDPRYFYDDCHFNEAGAREVAQRIADVLRSQPLRRRAAPS